MVSRNCEFLIGPSCSWFFPNNADTWNQPRAKILDDSENAMDTCCQENVSLSYFIYGSIGCFCYGETYHYLSQQKLESVSKSEAAISATLKHLIDVREDHSRVICTRFLQGSRRPLAMVLTENGSLLIHDCITNQNLVHFKKSDLLSKFSSEPEMRYEETYSEHTNKKPRFDNRHLFSSCVWPDTKNAFLGISLPKKNTILVFWLKLMDLTNVDSGSEAIQKNDIIESYEKLELGLPPVSTRSICCMESVMLNPLKCLVAVAMNDGLIVVARINIEQGQVERVTKLARHTERVSALSFLIKTDTPDESPLGLLASASRDSLVVVWDIEDETYFAYYKFYDEGLKRGAKNDWFALTFIPPQKSEQTQLIVSNPNNGLTVFKLPKNKPRTDVRLREAKEKYQKKQYGGQTNLSHHGVIFNIVSDPMTQTLMTTSIDGNIIFWNCYRPQLRNVNEDAVLLELKPEYLHPTMSDNSRTHMMRHSPIRTDFMSLALGKGGVKFYKVSANHRFDMSSSCSEIGRMIMKASLSPTSVAWHPNHEYRLAIGTLEGKVLRVDITPRRATLAETETKKLNTFRFTDEDTTKTSDNIFDVEYKPLERDDVQIDSSCSLEPSKTDGIYSISWGPDPCCPQDISRLAIYAIGSISHRLSIYENYNSKKESGEGKEKLKDYLDEFLDQSLPEAIGEASEIAWKSSMDLMALGTTTGKIIIVSYLDEAHADRSRNRLFRKLAVIQGPLGNTYIQCLVWHPTTQEDDPHYYQIAASANESPGFVFDIKESLLVADIKTRLRIKTDSAGDIPSAGTTTTNIVSSYVYKLDGHKKPITDIIWSPHKPNNLATSSFDKYCFVWSLDDASSEPATRIISKFSARHRLFTVEWSLVDPDLIFTSGQDSTIWAWRPTENRVRN